MVTITAYEFEDFVGADSSWENLLTIMPSYDVFDQYNRFWGLYAELINYDNRYMIIIAREGSDDRPVVNCSSGEPIVVPAKVASVIKNRLSTFSRFILDCEIRYQTPQRVWFDHERGHAEQGSMVL